MKSLVMEVGNGLGNIGLNSDLINNILEGNDNNTPFGLEDNVMKNKIRILPYRIKQLKKRIIIEYIFVYFLNLIYLKNADDWEVIDG